MGDVTKLTVIEDEARLGQVELLGQATDAAADGRFASVVIFTLDKDGTPQVEACGVGETLLVGALFTMASQLATMGDDE